MTDTGEGVEIVRRRCLVIGETATPDLLRLELHDFPPSHPVHRGVLGYGRADQLTLVERPAPVGDPHPPTRDELVAAFQRGQREILGSIEANELPATVRNWEQLAEHIDADLVGGRHERSGIAWTSTTSGQLIAALDAWLQDGMPIVEVERAGYVGVVSRVVSNVSGARAVIFRSSVREDAGAALDDAALYLEILDQAAAAADRGE